MNKIRNVIFDMGNVLVEFNGDFFLERAGIHDSQDKAFMKQKIYYSGYWTQMDLGDMDEAQMCEELRKEVPERLQPFIEELVWEWSDPLVEVKGMSELVFELKEKGYGVYLLSNASRRQKEYWKNVSCSGYFDGTVVSAFEHVIKPDEKIYRILLERYGLKAEECLFVDDRPENVETAEKLGMKAFLFSRHEPLRFREYVDREVFEKEM